MAALHNDVFDNGLDVLNSVDGYTENLHILSADPGIDFAVITAGTTVLGVKATPTISHPGDRTGGGREVTISAITDGSVTATDTATHFALTDDSASKILASGALDASQVVTSGNIFTLTEFAIGIPDPA